MQISESQIDRQSLTQFGEEAVALLREGNFAALAERFGYALAYGRETAKAIEADLAASLSADMKSSAPIAPSMTIKYFNANAAESTGLVAAIECIIHADDGSAVLLALVVTRKGLERHITLEGIDRV